MNSIDWGEVQRQRNRGATLRTLARQYGVSHQTIALHVTRKRKGRYKECFACGSALPEDFDYHKFEETKIAEHEAFLRQVTLLLKRLGVQIDRDSGYHE